MSIEVGQPELTKYIQNWILYALLVGDENDYVIFFKL